MFTYSVIIPHYKRPKLLKRLLETIPIRKDIQIIVVDDNSPQEDFDYIKFWEEVGKRAKVILDKKGGGAGHARNLGLESARGKWLVFADSDDYFTPNAFEIFDKYIDSKYDIIYFGTCSVDSETGEISNRDQIYNLLVKNFSIDDINSINELRFNFNPPWGKMIKRDLVNDNKISFEEVPYSNDVMFSMKTAMSAKEITADTSQVYCITTSFGSLVNVVSLKAIKYKYLAKLKSNLYLKENNLTNYQGSIMYYLYMGLKLGGIKTLVEFFKLGLKYKANFTKGATNWLQTYINSHKDKKNKKFIKYE